MGTRGILCASYVGSRVELQIRKWMELKDPYNRIRTIIHGINIADFLPCIPMISDLQLRQE